MKVQYACLVGDFAVSPLYKLNIKEHFIGQSTATLESYRANLSGKKKGRSI